MHSRLGSHSLHGVRLCTRFARSLRHWGASSVVGLSVLVHRIIWGVYFGYGSAWPMRKTLRDNCLRAAHTDRSRASVALRLLVPIAGFFVCELLYLEYGTLLSVHHGPGASFRAADFDAAFVSRLRA